jgi:hypothetical protein
VRKKQLIGNKNAYYRGQLLLEDDFIAEQEYHTRARHRHNLNVHGWGVVRGLDVTPSGDSAVSVSPGFAIDAKGREIELREPEVLDLSGQAPGTLVWVALGYDEDRPKKGSEREGRIECFSVLAASTGIEEVAVALATVKLDERSRLTLESISTLNRRELHTLLTPGSVTPSALDARLRKGWIRLPFRPTALPQDEEGAPPPFRVGPTEAVTHRKYPGVEPNTRGAGGTMAIPLPPGITTVHRLRVAGSENEKGTTVTLLIGGWDPNKKAHIAKQLVHDELKSGAYDRTYDVISGNVDPEYHTLAIEIRSKGYTKVSLVAVEVSC